MKTGKAGKEGARVRTSPLIYGFVILYMAFQVLMPLRHYVYKRDLRWTHEGSNFSWRMMADHHETNGGITIEDPRTGEIYAHTPEQLLARKQLVMVNTPYMLLQYVHFLKQYLEQQTKIVDPIIKADVQVSVNGMPFQRMYDPTADLSKVEYSPLKDLKWIIPLNEN